eukprot:11130219-Ditylum_brightwellii.AAC.1
MEAPEIEHDKTQESESESHEEELIVQEQGGEENQDKLEGDGNDDAGLEVYGKDSKEVSIPNILIALQGEGKVKGES